MAAADDLLVAFEYHSPQMIRDALAAGADPRARIKGKAPIDCLIEMYSRSKRFADCMRVMFDAGATLDDPALKAVLLDDAEQLRELLRTGAFVLAQTFNLECTFTSLKGVSALHVCAEYNSVNCARVLLDAGADVDARAAIDGDGLGGHTPLFHTVNSNRNFARDMMELLVERGADLNIRLKGLVWGGGFEWETIVFDISLLSYAQCGLYRQFHRDEDDVYSNIAYLYDKRYGTQAPIRNVPNQYLQPKTQ